MIERAIPVGASLIVLFTNWAMAQASFLLANKVGTVVDAPVYDSAGIPLAGPNYRAELYGSATPDSLTPLLVLDEGLVRESVPFLTDGYFFSTEGFLCVMNVTPGNAAWLQVRAWDARLGATWEDVAAVGMGGYGESPLLYARGGDPTALPPTFPGPLIGLQSFSLRPVPEPSTWVSGSLGLVSLWWKMRNRRLKQPVTA